MKLHFFSLQAVSLWNSLPEEVVYAPSLNAFKGRLDKYRDNCFFSLDPEIFFTKTVGQQPKGHLGLNSKAEEDDDDDGEYRIFLLVSTFDAAANSVHCCQYSTA